MSSTTTAFAGLVDLASETVGGRALSASDDFFAEKENLVKAEPAVFLPEAYTDRGKWMDGWESRRKRVPGHDWCIVKLGVRGEIRGIDIDTAHFLGNHPPYASLDALDGNPETAEWTEILPQVPLQRGGRNLFASLSSGPYTHVRLHIYPDGGVARLRIYGEPTPVVTVAQLDLALLSNGGRAVAASDNFFSPMENLTLPTEAPNMGSGWETRRRRDPGADWIIVKLATTGTIREIELDTKHFKGNYPDRCAVEGICWPDAPPWALVKSDAWRPVLPPTKMFPDHPHVFSELVSRGPFTHLRLHAIPCGGVSRMRVRGLATTPTTLPPFDEAELLACCGSTRWARAMVAGQPYASHAHLLGAANVAWWRLDEADWREAFAAHPRIGGEVHASTRWAAAEQSGVSGAAEDTLRALAEGNRAYDERFGYLYIVCATGRSAEEMLADLGERLGNPPENEIRVAAGEQAKITAIRLNKLLDAR